MSTSPSNSPPAAGPDVAGVVRAGLVAAIVTIVIDQFNKWWLLDVFDLASRGRVKLTPFLDLIFVKNTGISYGWLPMDSQSGQWLLASFAVVASVVLYLWMRRAQTRLLAISVGLIIGGAVGNAIDRVRLGGVADFYSLHAFDFYWYIFNIADAAIVAGVAGLLYDSVITSRKTAANTS